MCCSAGLLILFVLSSPLPHCLSLCCLLSYCHPLYFCPTPVCIHLCSFFPALSGQTARFRPHFWKLTVLQGFHFLSFSAFLPFSFSLVWNVNFVICGVWSDKRHFMNVWGGLGGAPASPQYDELNKSETRHRLSSTYKDKHTHKILSQGLGQFLGKKTAS